LGVMLALCGLASDKGKSDDDMVAMLALGHEVSLLSDRNEVVTRLATDKADRWAKGLDQILMADRCDGAVAGKFAGRFSWPVTMQVDKIGRASIRPWYAAAHAPLPGGALGVWRRSSCH
jgi:hypothetical protein